MGLLRRLAFAGYLLLLGSLVLAEPPAMPLLSSGDSLLVVSPHPDDETLCCGGYIHASVKAGVRAYVVWITSGDGYWRAAATRFKKLSPTAADYRRLGRLRMREARAAGNRLGLADGDLIFLGFPDGGIAHLFDLNYLRPYTSPYTGWSSVGYRASPVFGSPYTGMKLEAALASIIRRIKPALILIPAMEDEHPDHWGTAKFAMSAALEAGLGAAVCRWVVHGRYGWPFPMGYSPESSMGFPPVGGAHEWSRFVLAADDEEAKMEALLEYGSQVTVMRAFLTSFIRRDELFACGSPDYLRSISRSEVSERRGSSW